jgi:hypothetical protein
MSSVFMHFVARAALFVAAFLAASASMLLVGAAFHSASPPAWLRDSPQARAAVAECAAASHRREQQACVRRVVADAQARDAGAARLAALRPVEPGGP